MFDSIPFPLFSLFLTWNEDDTMMLREKMSSRRCHHRCRPKKVSNCRQMQQYSSWSILSVFRIEDEYWNETVISRWRLFFSILSYVISLMDIDYYHLGILQHQTIIIQFNKKLIIFELSERYFIVVQTRRYILEIYIH